jgi:Uri superfamily endonuclease
VKGSYLLVVTLATGKDIVIGKLGRIHFPEATYAYVGSAMNGFKARLAHHLKEKKEPHWHIDYLLNEAEVLDILLYPSKQREECVLAQALAKRFESIAGFGSSDCRCKSHLYFGDSEHSTKERIVEAVGKAGITCKSYLRRSRENDIDI